MGYREQFFDECKAIIKDFSGLSILIPGCGPGHDCLPFALAGARVTGIDISQDLGDACSHANVEYHRGSIEGCHLPSNQFDVVFSIATMEHVPDIEAGFSEMVRLTRPGGLIYSVAAPLWNSRYGHHVNTFRRFPWIHLLLERQHLLELLHRHNITAESIDLPIIDFLMRQHKLTREEIDLQHVMD